MAPVPRGPRVDLSSSVGQGDGGHGPRARSDERSSYRPELDEDWPWIADDRRKLRFARPRWADARLENVIDDDVRLRVRRTLVALVENEAALGAAQAELSTTFSHGDAVRNNVSVGRARVVLFDWNACGRAAVGTDLGYLLSLPGPALDAAEVDHCRRAYRGGLASVASSVPADSELELGYRHRFVALSLRIQLSLLPPTRPHGHVARAYDGMVLTWTGRRRSRVEANLARICDEAQALLALIR